MATFKIVPAGGELGHTPLDATTGKLEQLVNPREDPYCAMMQVAAADTHCNYVVCRGWDPREHRYYEYEAGSATKVGIPVAKPFGKRMKGIYRVGQVFPAILPLSSGAERDGIIIPTIGQNPGKAEVTGDECKGHPEALTEEIFLLKDDSDIIHISWMLLDGGEEDVKFCTAEAHAGFGIPFTAYAPGVWNPSTHDYDFTCDTDHTHHIIDRDYGVPTPGAGSQGYAKWKASDTYGKILVVKTFDCTSRGPCCS
jgi:hypothetical protein